MSVYVHPGHPAKCGDIRVGDVTFWWSYSTIIAFRVAPSIHPVVMVNYWGPTTGRHMNAIDGGNKATRVNRQEFMRQLEEVTQRMAFGCELCRTLPL